MVYRITFNHETSVYGEHNEGWSLAFMRNRVEYINSRLQHRGYIYLNEICDEFGVEWDPKHDNPCCIYNGTPINFAIHHVKYGFEIDVTW